MCSSTISLFKTAVPARPRPGATHDRDDDVRDRELCRALRGTQRVIRLDQVKNPSIDSSATKNESKTNGVEMRSLRRMCGVSRKKRCRNSDVRWCDLKEDEVTRVERVSNKRPPPSQYVVTGNFVTLHETRAPRLEEPAKPSVPDIITTSMMTVIRSPRPALEQRGELEVQQLRNSRKLKHRRQTHTMSGLCGSVLIRPTALFFLCIMLVPFRTRSAEECGGQVRASCPLQVAGHGNRSPAGYRANGTCMWHVEADVPPIDGTTSRH
ncbi:hypothetical protein EVAR_102614_1 [Eumeta japonica]|uniref:CUB domain-containing protein n=1 Tax=Eumeta variegata TaxID=151549 RepID=A0A4C1TVL0_EUMVA|nr:hypothetical protein EVAR_102614_1 [Eumeta japonica]